MVQYFSRPEAPVPSPQPRVGIEPSSIPQCGMTDQTGTPVRDMMFYPFGQMWWQIGRNYDTRFAGFQQREFVSGLDPTLFRMYGSRLGRWMTPDPVAGDVMNPQSLNRYAHVLNNPTTLIDPLGLQTCSTFCYDPYYVFNFGAACYGCPGVLADVDPCNDWFYAITHAECSSPGTTIGSMNIPFCPTAGGAGRADAGGSACTEEKNGKPKSPFGSLCGDSKCLDGTRAKFIEEWTCRGAWDCCVEKKSRYVNSCYDRGKGYFAVERWFWGTPAVHCCYCPPSAKMRTRLLGLR